MKSGGLKGNARLLASWLLLLLKTYQLAGRVIQTRELGKASG